MKKTKKKSYFILKIYTQILKLKEYKLDRKQETTQFDLYKFYLANKCLKMHDNAICRRPKGAKDIFYPSKNVGKMIVEISN